ECADADALRRLAPPPTSAADRAQLDAAQTAAAQASALNGAGKYDAAIAQAARAAELAKAAGHWPTVADALITMASAKQYLGGAAAQVRPALRGAMRAAALGHADALEANAWIDFVHDIGEQESHYDQVEPWLPQVAALVERTGDLALAGRLDFTLASLAWRRG